MNRHMLAVDAHYVIEIVLEEEQVDHVTTTLGTSLLKKNTIINGCS